MRNALGSTETLKRTLEMFGELDSDQMGLERWLQMVDDQVTKFDLMSTLEEKKQVLSELQVNYFKLILNSFSVGCEKQF